MNKDIALDVAHKFFGRIGEVREWTHDYEKPYEIGYIDIAGSIFAFRVMGAGKTWLDAINNCMHDVDWELAAYEITQKDQK